MSDNIIPFRGRFWVHRDPYETLGEDPEDLQALDMAHHFGVDDQRDPTIARIQALEQTVPRQIVDLINAVIGLASRIGSSEADLDVVTTIKEDSDLAEYLAGVNRAAIRDGRAAYAELLEAITVWRRAP